MDIRIYTKLSEVLKAEGDNIMQHEKDKIKKLDKMDIIFNLKKILDNYDELEPILKKFFNEKAKKEKFER